jgi:LPPG:FO 2-phospho-L-lactate transferase
VTARILALSGGVGGAKLALGLQRVLSPGALTVVANTGDDFVHLGLAISPDIDTVLYTLAGLANPATGWGRAAETWQFMGEVERLGGPTWFRLGDKDLAVHVERTRRLAAGESLSSIVEDFARRFGIPGRVLPMTDDAVRTIVHSDAGTLAFQEYFVAQRCAPVVRRIEYVGAQEARPSSALDALQNGAFDAVVLCPSNPYLSLQPLLAVPAWREALERTSIPVVAVSPVIAGAAVKGPTAKIMRELGIEISAVSVARHYAGIIDGFVIDTADELLAPQIDVPVRITRTLMSTVEDKESLARAVVQFATALRSLD